MATKKEVSNKSKIPTPTLIITKSGRVINKPVRLNYV